MNNLPPISLLHLVAAFIPVVLVLFLLFRWSVEARTAVHALARMLLQLLLVGYALAFIFTADQAWIVIGVLAVMLSAASWISLRPFRKKTRGLYLKSLAAITCGGVFTLGIVTQLVLTLPSWFAPNIVIPLAGMIFANAMNCVSIAGERFFAETGNGVPFAQARQAGMRAALIPMVNTLFAVGIVSIPGMMTGQILSGVDPLIAARYQVMVMCMIFGSSGIAAGLFLRMLKPA